MCKKALALNNLYAIKSNQPTAREETTQTSLFNVFTPFLLLGNGFSIPPKKDKTLNKGNCWLVGFDGIST